MALAILLTGAPGSGKTTIAAELHRRGIVAYNIEEIPGMFAMVSKATGRTAKKWVDNGNLEEQQKYDWVCDVTRLRSLVAKNREKIAFYCGVAGNIGELLPLFDAAILLVPSAAVLRKRLETRTANDFGRDPAVRKWVLGWKGWFEHDMRARGAHPVNANGTVEAVADRVLEASRRFEP